MSVCSCYKLSERWMISQNADQRENNKVWLSLHFISTAFLSPSHFSLFLFSYVPASNSLNLFSYLQNSEWIDGRTRWKGNGKSIKVTQSHKRLEVVESQDHRKIIKGDNYLKFLNIKFCWIIAELANMNYMNISNIQSQYVLPTKWESLIWGPR